jgi:hypothetical protein
MVQGTNLSPISQEKGAKKIMFFFKKLNIKHIIFSPPLNRRGCRRLMKIRYMSLVSYRKDRK